MNTYMQKQYARNNENFLDADGWAQDANQYFSPDELGADAGAATAAAPAPAALNVDYSTPYIVNLVVGTVNVSNVEVLDAALRASNTTTTGITYSYGSGSLTYAQFLSVINSGSGIFEVGVTRIIVSNTSASIAYAQITATITIESVALDGTLLRKPIYPSLPGNQYSQTQVDIPYTFKVNGLTKFTVGTCYANSTIQIRFYPMRIVNPFKQLNEGTGVSEFKNPGINKMA